ncbi:glycerol-3-phosphate dehydrogenase/oxidase [Mucilaginibacter myungsuensis]|uniref:Glycerol-3-phosphate dehydrogenase/oxidase n=1 Tax=Mucilaginibacter myungsuensis TaxID=649104 RepID=A0A929PVW1_9SPHI|nr:glycerol-3-phosphate dehydrogenase/oxidase [Mucilaginibacter myungsuensis]MBE9661534.1 glycerol-3-phosphate dehydrogenase/oxidase [Mucilaginibacter myungsuensis]MDN3597677.1 glycerol-3-phosphate dehydrogenase/oxidase [Mucilaginibacter myungsuensis]
MKFERDAGMATLVDDVTWDVVVIGGGATGLGTAVDAALRGYKTLLVEQADFAKGTSSRSTKLVHGGVRYLAQGDIALVYEALKERGLLFKNAPHLVKEQEFIIPCYSWFSKLQYLAGLKFYDLLAGKGGFKHSAFLSADEVIAAIPTLDGKGLVGGVRYSDGQFDDARLAINLAQTCAEHGGTLINYMKVTGLLRTGKKVNGIKATDLETGREFSIKGRAIINATGVFVDEILRMDIPGGRPLVRPSQGVHLVLDKSFLNGESALMIPKTSDGRVLFAVPWHGSLLLGTTDTPLNEHSLEPVALEKEIDFILTTANQYLAKKPKRSDVLSVFAGLRPLAASNNGSGATKEISRSHKLIVSASGLITITGGKWTTYRKMAEDVVDKAIEIAGLQAQSCRSKTVNIHGYAINIAEGPLAVYGSDADGIQNIITDDPSMGDVLLKGHAVTKAEVLWSTRNEMARSVEDILARRLRVLFLDAKAAILMAPVVAGVMAAELGYSKEWEIEQVADFKTLANRYLLTPFYPEIDKNVTNRIAV